MTMREQDHLEETCLICGQQNVEGIHICNQLICESCQKKIVETDVTNWKYKFYMNKLAKLRIGQSQQTVTPVVIQAGAAGEADKH
ncbi:sigma factor G inhibitor Gin [Sporolactobacillus nakayamae]|uniref:Inhibitor of sigma-G Gin n=1 Tax=Sporolactobacillus nakayamae TaxID=269670 RepID=A0A1I2UKA9_9BACL|nr:sigma factor G inhibitor Gin [Sporolactobacillus nakayamae]SFG76769.1 Inhibitor of sigma-G Gin [Sporolactobacillus nakayamae]